jgi:hypothetical protein
MAEQEAFKAAEDLLRKSARDESRHKRELERIERLRSRRTESSVFDARGVLVRSLARGDASGKRWYKLQNPKTAQVTAFLEIGPDSHINVERYVGKLVGVEGDKVYEPKLGIEVWKVRAIVVLGPATPATQPARESSD